MKKKLMVIQPIVPHYRKAFFDALSKRYRLQVLYAHEDKSFENVRGPYTRKVKSLSILRTFVWFSVVKEILSYKPHVVITYGVARQLTNLFLLVFKKILGFRIIIWSHGFRGGALSFGDRIRLAEMKLSDGVLFYTEECARKAHEHGVRMASYLNNTLCAAHLNPAEDFQRRNRSELMKRYGIATRINGVFISRFTSKKAPNLLLDIIRNVIEKRKDVGFIIVGDGEFKPDLRSLQRVYDFGRVYDEEIKTHLFFLSDFALMPRWVGLSVVECFWHCLPMITLSPRIPGIEHSVEFNYIRSSENGFVAESLEQLIDYPVTADVEELRRLGRNAYQYAKSELAMESMVERAVSFIDGVAGTSRRRETR